MEIQTFQIPHPCGCHLQITVLFNSTFSLCCVVLECAGDVCLYMLVVCSEWLFVVDFSTHCNWKNTVCCDVECAGDVCLYTLVVCEWLFVVAFSTCCNCCDSYFVSFNSTCNVWPYLYECGSASAL